LGHTQDNTSVLPFGYESDHDVIFFGVVRTALLIMNSDELQSLPERTTRIVTLSLLSISFTALVVILGTSVDMAKDVVKRIIPVIMSLGTASLFTFLFIFYLHFSYGAVFG
jgi:hypothetical protein